MSYPGSYRPRAALSALLAILLPGATLSAAQTPATPVRYLVVLYQENVSFDHYFATYPHALNPPGEPAFSALPGTPTVNGLTGALLTRNRNAAAPFRFARSQAATCDQDHEYTDEQAAYDGGLLDRFVPATGPAHEGKLNCQTRDVMGYFDGNTVTALWQYAQHFAMSDAHFGTTFGPSTPGALNLAAAQTHGASGDCSRAEPAAHCQAEGDHMSSYDSADIVEHTVISDPDPLYDDCSHGPLASMVGPNIGTLLSAHHVSWGFFAGGFRVRAGLPARCESAHEASDGRRRNDYIPHHEPFQYYQATANPHHVPPSAPTAIGEDDPANHQYDLEDFWVAASVHHLPAVSFIKARAFEDGHAGYSDPLAEQRYLVDTINRLQQLPEWSQMLIVIAYDDSDGWYDHVMPPIIRASATAADALSGAGRCGTPGSEDLPARCGLGPRLPLLVVSPFARRNFVDHHVSEQASITRFIEDNWHLGRLGGGAADADAGVLDPLLDFSAPTPTPILLLDPNSGEPRSAAPRGASRGHARRPVNP